LVFLLIETDELMMQRYGAMRGFTMHIVNGYNQVEHIIIIIIIIIIDLTRF